jgi:hypothetical protein
MISETPITAFAKNDNKHSANIPIAGNFIRRVTNLENPRHIAL